MIFYPELPIGSGARLIPLRMDHAERLFSIIDAERERIGEFLDWVETMQEVIDAERYCAKRITKSQAATCGIPTAAVFTICHDDTIVGLINLHEIDASKKSADIGYWISKSAEGQGLVTAAVLGISAYAFTWLALEKLFIGCNCQNKRSANVALRAGFRESHDHEVTQTTGLWFELDRNGWRDRLSV